MDSLEIARAVRRTCGLFVRADRGLIELRGADRVHWLNGMVTNDVRGLDSPDNQSCCYALSLSSRGIILGDYFVIGRPDALWLDLDRAQLASSAAHLQKFIIADDVSLADESPGWAHLSLEGPKAMELLSEFTGYAGEIAPGAVRPLALGDTSVLVAGYGWSGERAAQLFVRSEEVERILDDLRRVGEGIGLVEGDAESLKILRVEAGIPDLQAELLPDVLPFEARLEEAVSSTKGCYVGQEIMARLASRGHVNYLLVGLRFEKSSEGLPAIGASIFAEEESKAEKVGELTSLVVSPKFGAIGMGYVRAAEAEGNTRLRVGEHVARVSALPFSETSS